MDPLVAWLNSTAFSVGAISASRAESIGAALGVWMVVCNIRVNPLAWPLAISSSALYLLVFWQARLYGDAGLQVLFIAVALWGWWQWLRGHQADGSLLRVRYLPARGQLVLIAAFVVLWPATGLFLLHATDTDVPWWDAFPTAGSVIGQWLLARKYVENWPAWIAVNAVGVALFAYKGLWLTVGLYALFLVMAAGGWLAWHRLATARPARTLKR
jgi:nicotinamide mononucleotide transporter